MNALTKIKYNSVLVLKLASFTFIATSKNLHKSLKAKAMRNFLFLSYFWAQFFFLLTLLEDLHICFCHRCLFSDSFLSQPKLRNLTFFHKVPESLYVICLCHQPRVRFHCRIFDCHCFQITNVEILRLQLQRNSIVRSVVYQLQWSLWFLLHRDAKFKLKILCPQNL